MNAGLTLGQNHHLFRPLSPWREKMVTVLTLLWVPPMPWALDCLTDASNLPADRLRGQAESCSIQLAESNLPGRMLSSYARGHGQSLSMWAEASIVLRPLLADSKDTSRKSSEKLQGWQLWRHWPKVGGHLIMKAKNNVLLSLNSPFPVV